MNKNEIKKALYKEKPEAHAYDVQSELSGTVARVYKSNCSLGEIKFSVPFKEMGEREFDLRLPAQLLIRWLDIEKCLFNTKPEESYSTFELRKPIYNMAMNTWGKQSQMEMAQEEATELALAVRKQLRKNTEASYMELVGEIADVEIMIEQMEFMHEDKNMRVLIENTKVNKIKRLLGRLVETSYEAIEGE